jgi:cytoskeletal protein RodZ
LSILIRKYRMEQLGEYLKNEREKQGKALDDIARATRIPRATLRVIESGPEEKLPPTSYLRGFVKLYARELGLNVDDVLERLPGRAAENIRVGLPRSVDLDTPNVPWFKICLTALLLCAVCLWAVQLFLDDKLFVQDEPLTIVSPRPALPDDNSSVSQEQPLPSEQEEPDPGPSEPAHAAVPQPDQAAPPATEPFTVRFRARGVVWIQMHADEEAPVDITLRDGERYSITADTALAVRLGDPTLVDIWYNDIPVSVNGSRGKPLDVHFPEGAR